MTDTDAKTFAGRNIPHNDLHVALVEVFGPDAIANAPQCPCCGAKAVMREAASEPSCCAACDSYEEW